MYEHVQSCDNSVIATVPCRNGKKMHKNKEQTKIKGKNTKNEFVHFFFAVFSFALFFLLSAHSDFASCSTKVLRHTEK